MIRRVKRNTVLFIVIAAAAVLVLVLPMRPFMGRTSTGAVPAVDPAVLGPLAQSAAAAARAPEQYVLSCFDRHDVVFLGEFYKIRQNVVLVSALVPRLAAAGVLDLGMEYALSDSQAGIDALLAAPTWDEARARGLLIDWVPTWGYQEYVDILRAAWEVNRARPAGKPSFRVVGLNVRQDWELLKTEKDAQDPATVRRIMARGIPDAHMAEVILREFCDRGRKALVYCGTQHALTRFRSREYERSATDMGLAETRRAGNIVFDRIGDRAFTVLLHAPWPDRRSRTGMAWAAGGLIDALIAALPADKRQAGWDTAGTALGQLPITSGSYKTGYSRLTLAELCGGYIVQGPLADYRAATPIPDFVPADREAEAVKNFPGLKPSALTLADVNRAVLDDAKTVESILAQFRPRAQGRVGTAGP
jgi:hypothetical protein